MIHLTNSLFTENFIRVYMAIKAQSIRTPFPASYPFFPCSTQRKIQIYKGQEKYLYTYWTNDQGIATHRCTTQLKHIITIFSFATEALGPNLDLMWEKEEKTESSFKLIIPSQIHFNHSTNFLEIKSSISHLTGEWRAPEYIHACIYIYMYNRE